MQGQDSLLPLFLNLDSDYTKLKPNESPFIKDMGWDININPNGGIGTNNPSGEGQNMFVLTPTKSNVKFEKAILPLGINRNIGNYESPTTQEEYYFNFNSNGNHGIYIIDGNIGEWYKVIEDPNLLFSDDPKSFIAEHRVTLRLVYNDDGSIREKYLIITDGASWQKCINVIAAVKTNGFDVSLYPYWSLLPPHFDRRELLELAPRPIMYKPEVDLISNTEQDKGKVNTLIDKAFQFSCLTEYTDKRRTTISPFSVPLIVSSTDYLSNPDSIPKKASINIYAGSCMVEKIIIYVRESVVVDGSGSLLSPEWGDWYQYDVINKYSSCGSNSSENIGDEYWRRTNPWDGFNYNSVYNKITYQFDNSKVGQIVDQDIFNTISSSMPLKSVSLTDIGDAMLLSNNEYGYNNLSCETMNNLGIESFNQTSDQCTLPYRNIKLYAYVGRDRALRGNEDTPRFGDAWTSQVGYHNGDNTIIKWGGLFLEADNAYFDETESDSFKLNFAGRDSFIMYLKGTPFTAVGVWYVSDSNNNLTKLDHIIDISNTSDILFVRDTFRSGGFFVCMFEFNVPAGRYLAAIGRHNVASSEDFRNKSTYVYGLADSKQASDHTYPGGGCSQTVIIRRVPIQAVVSGDKEYEIDCTSGDIDTWGNGRDLFYIVTPFIGSGKEGCGGASRARWSFVEGYLKESKSLDLAVEKFGYVPTNNPIGHSGGFTDKNGFFWGYSWGGEARHLDIDIAFTNKVNCIYPTTFIVNGTSSPFVGGGWREVGDTYFDNYNGGVVGYSNYIVLKAKITNIAGDIGYSNIGVSIKNGMTDYTDGNGEATLIIHNGGINPNIENVYVNAGGNFNITTEGCQYVPLFQYNDSLVPCQNATERVYPVPLQLGVIVQGGSVMSVKSSAKYSIGVVGADLAGRLQYVNVIGQLTTTSFLERNNTFPAYLRVLINGALNINTLSPDIKWISPYVSKAIGVKRYVQWVGDKIQYIDESGNVTSSPNNAVFCKINIQSLYDFNVKNNFSVLAKYQFAKGDRIVILDDGEGQLFDVATYGDPLDIQVLGTDYNQAAINAGLLPPETNVVLNNATVTEDNDIGVIVKYDSRLDKLKDKTGFWVEIYTPSQISDKIPYFECAGFYPVIDGEVQSFDGYDDSGNPIYTPLTSIDLDYWDTYLINRNIAITDVGNKSFNHPFESPNITDTFGVNITSGGRVNTKNDNAVQYWDRGNTIKSDDFQPYYNGLATFRDINKKNFSEYPFGGIVAMITQRNIIIVICENDWFSVDYNMPYARVENGNLVVVNLDNSLSQPHQKKGQIYGCSLEHTSSIVFNDDYIFWCDTKNMGYILCNYSSAQDISRTDSSKGIEGNVQSYFNKKIEFISQWNNRVSKDSIFDIVSGIDPKYKNVYVTFRPRRQNTNNIMSYINNRNNTQLNHQETIVFNTISSKWVRFSGFTPESYGKIRGNKSGMDFIAYAAGGPYLNNTSDNKSFCNYFGVVVQPSIIGVINKGIEVVKILQSLSLDSNDISWYIDMIYSSERDSFSYIPLNYFKKEEGIYYSETLRDMNSYPPIDPSQIFRSMLFDGKRIFGTYFLFRLMFNLNKLGTYTELKNIYYKVTQSPANIIEDGKR